MNVDTESLTETQWQIAHAIAQALVKTDADVNELGKAIAYLRASVHKPDAGAKFFKYLKTLVSNGRQIGHSGRTPEHYRNIEKACSQYLQSQQANPHSMLQILGWTSRLMRYYKVTPVSEEGTTPEISVTPAVSQRQEAIAKVVQSQQFTVGQIVEAKVANKKEKGSEVTYEILGTIKLSNKEPKKYSTLSIGQTVQVEIIDLKEDDTPKKVKLIS